MLVDVVAPLAAFLVAAIWLAALAERAGVAEAIAARLSSRRRRGWGAYTAVCALTALLTATISLDGAVVVVVPVVLALTRGARALRRPLLLATIAVANAFSLAVPQGNPANVVVMRTLGLDPGELIARMAAPATVAALLCAVAIAVAERHALGCSLAEPPPRCDPAPTGAANLAWLALLAAGLGGAISPWIGLNPLWTICAVAAVAAVLGLAAGVELPFPKLPVRICAEVAALGVALGVVVSLTGLPAPPATTLPLLALLALGAAGVAAVAGNLPASVVFGAVLAHASSQALATLTGLGVGALASPRGSVATLIALERAGPEAARDARRGWARTLSPVALVATVGAVALLGLGA